MIAVLALWHPDLSAHDQEPSEAVDSGLCDSKAPNPRRSYDSAW